jgi:predicted porin
MNRSKRDFILLAVACAAVSSAHAQQSSLETKVGPATVKFYGVADVYVGKLNGKLTATETTGKKSEVTQHFSGLGSGGLTSPRLGVTVSTSFAEGSTGFFTMELGPTRIDQTSASVTNGLDKTRKSFVGVRGAFGEVTAGRLQSAAYEWSFKHAPMSGALDPIFSLAIAAGASMHSADRINDAIAYSSPKMSGLTVKAAYAFANSRGGQSDVSVDDGAIDNHKQSVRIVAFDYESGPLSLGGAYRSTSDSNGMCANAVGAIVKCATANSSSLKDGKDEWGLGAIYDFGSLKVTTSMQSVRPNAARYSNKINTLGAEIPVSAAGKVVASFAMGHGKRDIVGATGTTTVDTKAQGFAVAYKQDINKYLTWYAGVVCDRNGANPFGTGVQLSSRTASATVTNGNGFTYSAAPNAWQYGAITGLRLTF